MNTLVTPTMTGPITEQDVRLAERLTQQNLKMMQDTLRNEEKKLQDVRVQLQLVQSQREHALKANMEAHASLFPIQDQLLETRKMYKSAKDDLDALQQQLAATEAEKLFAECYKTAIDTEIKNESEKLQRIKMDIVTQERRREQLTYENKAEGKRRSLEPSRDRITLSRLCSGVRSLYFHQMFHSVFTLYTHSPGLLYHVPEHGETLRSNLG